MCLPCPSYPKITSFHYVSTKLLKNVRHCALFGTQSGTTLGSYVHDFEDRLHLNLFFLNETTNTGQLPNVCTFRFQRRTFFEQAVFAQHCQMELRHSFLEVLFKHFYMKSNCHHSYYPCVYYIIFIFKEKVIFIAPKWTN